MKKLMMIIAMIMVTNTAFSAPKLERIYLESHPSFELKGEKVKTLLNSTSEDGKALREILELAGQVTQEDLRNSLSGSDDSIYDKAGGCRRACVEVCVAGVCGSVCGEVCDS
jgi:hypothetical protein